MEIHIPSTAHLQMNSQADENKGETLHNGKAPN